MDQRDDEAHWSPRCELPADLVRPARIDPTGRTGPTRGQTQRCRFRQVAHGWYVPRDVDSSRVEQRILEQGMRVRGKGAVTAWASLRWRGVAYFDGTSDATGGLLPVPLLLRSGVHPSDDARGQSSRRQLPPYDREFVRGLWCTTTERAVFDEVRTPDAATGVAAICMTLAAGITAHVQLLEYAALRVAWEGIPLFRDALALSNECFRSGQEVYRYLRWILDAGLPPPLVNPPVFDLSGRLLGYPDLLDRWPA